MPSRAAPVRAKLPTLAIHGVLPDWEPIRALKTFFELCSVGQFTGHLEPQRSDQRKGGNLKPPIFPLWVIVNPGSETRVNLHVKFRASSLQASGVYEPEYVTKTFSNAPPIVGSLRRLPYSKKAEFVCEVWNSWVVARGSGAKRTFITRGQKVRF